MTSHGPNAFVVGAAKAGTTSLVRYLAQHPDVFAPPTKEPNYYLCSEQPLNEIGPASRRTVRFLLNRYSVVDPAAFDALYAPGAASRIRLDGSVRYLYHPNALERIERDVRDARYIVVLRDPVERLISHWRMNRRYQLEPLSLTAALAAEDVRVAAGWGWDWHYRRVGTYAPQLARLFKVAAPERVHVILYGDLARDPDAVARACFRFLGVDDDVVVDTREHGNIASEPRHRVLDRVISRPGPVSRLLKLVPNGAGFRFRAAVQSWNAAAPAVIDATETASLSEMFDDDAAAVAALLALDPDELRFRMRGFTPAQPSEAAS